MGAPPLTPGARLRQAEYPALSGTFLNAASYGPLPQRTLQAVRDVERRRASAAITPDDFAGTFDAARREAAALIGAQPRCVALTPNTSSGIAIAAQLTADRARPGRRTVLLWDREFPANVYPWLALQRRGLVDVEMIAVDDAGLPRHDALLDRLLKRDVVTLSVSAVQFATGYRADLVALGAACAAQDVLFSVDAIQALGAVPVDAAEAQVAVLACGAQKWLCSPWGTGFACIRDDLLTAHEPGLPGWLSFGATTDFSGLLSYDYDLLPDARRWEFASLAVQGFRGMAASIGLIREVGVQQIFQHVQQLLEPLREWGRQHHAAVLPDPAHASCIAAVAVPDADRLHARLDAVGVTCVPREGALRFSPHFYNTMDDIERVLDILQDQ